MVWTARGIYRARLEAAIAHVAVPEAIDDAPPMRLSLVRGSAWPILMRNPDSAAGWRLFEPALSTSIDPEAVTVTDRLRQTRAAYPGLFVYALFGALSASGRVVTRSEAERAIGWIDYCVSLVDEELGELATSSLAAARGDAVAAAAWAALAAAAGGDLLHDDRPTAAASRVLRRLIDGQRPAGHYLAVTSADTPETWWFHELQLAHAMASFGVRTGSTMAIESASRAARYHWQETQVDHATSQPWGLTAFLLDPQTHMVADEQLHAVEQARVADGPDAISLILMADALDSLSRRH